MMCLVDVARVRLRHACCSVSVSLGWIVASRAVAIGSKAGAWKERESEHETERGRERERERERWGEWQRETGRGGDNRERVRES